MELTDKLCSRIGFKPRGEIINHENLIKAGFATCQYAEFYIFTHPSYFLGTVYQYREADCINMNKTVYDYKLIIAVTANKNKFGDRIYAGRCSGVMGYVSFEYMEDIYNFCEKKNIAMTSIKTEIISYDEIKNETHIEATS